MFIFVLILLIFLGVFPIIVAMSNYWLTLLVMMAIYAITATSLNIMIGYGGLISIGHGGFLMIGTYTVAILSDRYEFPFLLVFILSGVVTGIIGIIIALSAAKLSGHFLAVVTLGFGISVPVIALNWNSLTNGYSGLLISRPDFFSSKLGLYYFVIVCLVLILWLIHNIVNSGIGRAFISIRESEVAAKSSGINTTFYKVMMFVISAFFTGLAGGLYGYWIGFAGPTDFPITTSFLLLAMIVVGGMHSFYGPIVGATLLAVIPHFTDEYAGITNVVIGFTLVIVILFRPNGLVTVVEWLKRKKASTEVSVEKEV